ncbi:hypothetical protein [Sporichthya sp.]|uniref:hypothetical protein n=1 Tax=Sporichthya sp. TaxID=65475 RepID=UPI0017BAD7FF|nr:hypothetical protein [Sporichthya sp.]MBA3743906.1 hypothetical protein [Sporichthya sp.]
MADLLEVTDQGRLLTFGVEDLLRYHGPGSPAGVALAFKVLQRWLPLPVGGAPERREIAVTTAFRGPGARDGFELVTRAVTEGRYVLDATMERPDRGWVLEQFVFRITYRGTARLLLLRPGFVDEEFISLARAERSPADETRFTALKAATAKAILACAADEVVEIEP